MKKVIILLVLIFTTLSVGAQIKRDFDGIILGKTTKKEVKSYLSKKSHYCEEKEDGNEGKETYISAEEMQSLVKMKLLLVVYCGTVHIIVFTRTHYIV